MCHIINAQVDVLHFVCRMLVTDTARLADDLVTRVTCVRMQMTRTAMQMESREPTDALSVQNGAETAVAGHGDGASMHLGIGGVKHGVEGIDGSGSHADASSGHREVQSVETDANRTGCHGAQSNGIGIHADMASGHMGARLTHRSKAEMNTDEAIKAGQLEMAAETKAAVTNHGDDTESGGNVDSRRVEGARLPTESQGVCTHQRLQTT